jgi:hypothetical protein
MNRINYLWGIGLLAIIMSCSSSNEPKEISPTSTEFTSGQLAKLIEVVDEPCQLSYAEKEGAIATQFIKLKVKLRLKKESPELKKVDAQDINFTGLLSVATINLVDENETKVQDLDVKSEDMLKLKKLLQKEEGAEETITFEGEFHNSDDAPTWFKEAAAFTPYLTGDVIVGDGVVTSTSSSFDIEGSHNLQGTVDKYPITMHLEIDGSTAKGTYYYDKQGSNAKLKLSGSYEDDILDLNETDADGTPTGHFRGKFANGVFKGHFITNQGKKMPFVVSEEDADNDDFSFDSSDDEITSSDDDFAMGDGDASIDEFLDEYEKFWRSYMKFFKKVDKNDPTAMIEYAKLLEQYNDYNKKLSKIKGNMSIDQLNRINKMSAEMMEEMSKMQQ